MFNDLYPFRSTHLGASDTTIMNNTNKYITQTRLNLNNEQIIHKTNRTDNSMEAPRVTVPPEGAPNAGDPDKYCLNYLNVA